MCAAFVRSNNEEIAMRSSPREALYVHHHAGLL